MPNRNQTVLYGALSLIAISTLTLTGGCGALGVGQVLRPMVVQRCEAANLNGCDEIASGIFELADGKASAVVTIKRGAALNQPARLKAFRENMMCARDLVTAIPGTKDSLKPVFDAVELLQPSDGVKPVSGPDVTDGKSLFFAVDCKNSTGAAAPCAVWLASGGDDSVSLSLILSGHRESSVTLSARDVQRLAQVLAASRPELKTARR